MSRILDEIKGAFAEYIRESDDSPACANNPFDNQWMHYYLFPEVLMVAENYTIESYAEASVIYDSFEDFLESYSSSIDGLIVFPCWVLPESEVLRIMAEHGLL